VLAHEPLVVPAIVATLVVETLGSASTLEPGEWVAAGAGVLVGCLGSPPRRESFLSRVTSPASIVTRRMPAP
jgi:hypothetical protein